MGANLSPDPSPPPARIGRFRRFSRWAQFNKRRFILTYGVLMFGGSMTAFGLVDVRPHGIKSTVLLVLLCAVGGYLWGWVMWHYLKGVRSLTSRRSRSD
jgi:hypothetical protein